MGIAKSVVGSATVGKKIAAVGALAVVGCLAVAWGGNTGVGSVGDAITAQTETATALRNHLESDMMHDALRGDVLAAILADTPADEEVVRADLADHEATFESKVAENKKLNLPADVRKALDGVSEPLQTYLASAKEFVELGLNDPVAARSRLPEFLEVFGTLEEQMGKVSDAVTASAQAAAVSANDEVGSARTSIWIAFGIAGIAVALVCWRITRGITTPLRRSVTSLQELAAKNLTATIEVSSSDETATMAEALNAALGSLSAAMESINRNSGTLNNASNELLAVSSEIAASAEQTSAQSGVASIAGDEVSGNVAAVATAVEEMTASVQEIAQSTSDAARVASDAVDLAEATNRDVARLGEASIEIGNVVKVITGIAEQTNLLALNATIEAARAGDSGKGFAVVANEVKELANETAKATEDISRRIDEIQSETVRAVDSIQQITEIINRISDYQNSIAGAVEEQAATTHEIGRAVADAARGSAEIAVNIAGIASAAATTADGIANTQMAASDLGRVAKELAELVGEFRY